MCELTRELMDTISAEPEDLQQKSLVSMHYSCNLEELLGCNQ